MSAKSDWDSLKDGIKKGDWKAVEKGIGFAVKSNIIDVWYDYQPLTDAMNDQGYKCYTCFMKAKGVYPQSLECYLKYVSMPEARESLIKRHCVESGLP